MKSSRSLAPIEAGITTLGAYPARTMLSTLGIIIGVAALVAVLALGDGIERFARDQIERTTSVQSVIVTPRTFDVIDGTRFPRDDFLRFTEADVEEVAREVGGIADLSLMVTGGALLSDTVRPPRAAQVIGTTAETATVFGLTTTAGRFFTEEEARTGAPVAVISHRLAADQAGESGVAGVVGDSVRLHDAWARVVGVLADRNSSDRTAYVPIRIAERFMAASSIPRAPDLVIKARRVEDVREVERRITGWLTRKDASWSERASLQTMGARVRQAEQGMLIFKLSMGAITGISLLVGGIGIMNVLLASVVERTREIGVRKSIGASQRDILVQFLVESVTVSGLGSVLGVGLGLAGAFGITALIRAQSEAKLYAAFSWSTVLVAALAAVLIGLAFGIYPALRAARLSPIDAIRHE